MGASRYILCGSKKLDLTCLYAREPEREQPLGINFDLPTWLPNFALGGAVSRETHVQCRWMGPAQRGAISYFLLVKEDQILVLRSFDLDTIITMGNQIPMESSVDLSGVLFRIQEWDMFLARTMGDHRYALCRILTFGLGEWSYSHYTSLLEGFLRRYKRVSSRFTASGLGCRVTR